MELQEFPENRGGVKGTERGGYGAAGVGIPKLRAAEIGPAWWLIATSRIRPLRGWRASWELARRRSSGRQLPGRAVGQLAGRLHFLPHWHSPVVAYALRGIGCRGGQRREEWTKIRDFCKQHFFGSCPFAVLIYLKDVGPDTGHLFKSSCLKFAYKTRNI